MDNKLNDYNGTNHKIRYSWEQIKELYGKLFENEKKLLDLQEELNTLKKKSFLSPKPTIEAIYNPTITVTNFATYTATGHSTSFDLSLPKFENCFLLPEVSLGQIYLNNFSLIEFSPFSGSMTNHRIGWFQRECLNNNIKNFRFIFWIAQGDGFFLGQTISANIRIWKVPYGI